MISQKIPRDLPVLISVLPDDDFAKQLKVFSYYSPWICYYLM